MLLVGLVGLAADAYAVRAVRVPGAGRARLLVCVVGAVGDTDAISCSGGDMPSPLFGFVRFSA